MIRTVRGLSGFLLCGAALWLAGIAAGDELPIPEVLKPWRAWVTWENKQRDCPTTYNSAEDHICFWPSRLTLSVHQGKATWALTVNVFADSWIPLPGSEESWPQNVQANQKPVAVLERAGKPLVRLEPGQYQISGDFAWTEMPQRVALPKEIGILSLVLDGKSIDTPNWDANGDVWLKRVRAEAAEKDFLATRVYRVIEDGVPIWLRTVIELTVSGKSREESLGSILPEGWRLSFVESSIPVAVDQQGRVQAQVRAGKWTIAIDAFRTTNFSEFQYDSGAKPVAKTELIGLKAQPSFRSVELSGIQPIDVTQTTFPAQWRELPVYEWKTDTSFKLIEKMRGMGSLRPEGLTINRRFWLDDDGGGLTYRDSLSGHMQQIWRLDATEGQEVGAVRIDGVAQLVTTNPKTGAHGVEIRTRNLNVEAIGRIARAERLSATGWRADADNLRLTLILPPGWRLLALLGADQVQGDWLTAWTLLDLFLLLIFSIAIVRLWGFKAGLVALFAFALAYHERGAPRYTWFLLLIPLALLRVVPEGAIRRLVLAWKYLALLFLAICLIPFLAMQIQTAIYPQLESPGVPYNQRTIFPLVAADFQQAMGEMRAASLSLSSSAPAASRESKGIDLNIENMQYDPNAKIQTGPAEPAWSWNQVYAQWNGPVSADQQITPVLIPLFWHRVITVLRVLLLLALILGLLRQPGKGRGFAGFFDLFSKRATAIAILAAVMLPAWSIGRAADTSVGPIPSEQMLETLRNRLLEPSDAYPLAAEIASAKLQVRGGRLSLESEIHAALDVAVPLPGRLPTWSPLSIRVDDGQRDVAVCRREGYLWVNVPKGVHKVVVDGVVADASEWEWTFLLKPRRVVIEAPDWNVTGIRPNGIPEQQLFFAKKQKANESQPTYDRKDFSPIVVVERQIEVGLVWKVHNIVTRLSSPGKAISLKLPLLPREGVLTSNLVLQNGVIEVRLASGETRFEWDSELPIAPSIQLAAQNNEQWVEQWQLVASPVWNVALSGLAPVFDAQQQNLIPTWHPWSGESVTLTFTRPVAVSGDTVTVQNVYHEIALGDRQRGSRLKLDLECSMGGDFPFSLSPEAEVTSLTLDGKALPLRREGKRMIIYTHPGKQSIEATWRTPEAMTTVAKTEPIGLPVNGANITTVVNVPESRWVLWAQGPQRGPAIRFWPVLAFAVLVALVLGSTSLSPLSRISWVLLAIGLTQINVVAALVVVVWLFLLAWRGRQDPHLMSIHQFNWLQVALVLLTFMSLGILVVVASKGLLGQPKMFVLGNDSTQTSLQWFQPRAQRSLPEPYVVSVSVWCYRYAMLGWALWLAASLLRWLAWGWKQFAHGRLWKRPGEKSPQAPVMAEVVS